LDEKFLFHGAGSANIGLMKLLHEEAGVPMSSMFVTNSRGLIWRSEDGTTGNFRNEEQKAFGQIGEPTFSSKDLTSVVEQLKPSCVIGAVGVVPNCFTKPMIEALVRVNEKRPVVFALSNPKTQAEVTASDAYKWSDGKVIYGSGTWFAPVDVKGKTYAPGQVNNVYIFPGVSFGAVCCQATSIPERLFMVAAEAVASSLGEEELRLDMVVPGRDRIQEVVLNVATAVALEAQTMGLAGKQLGKTYEEVRAALNSMRWTPQAPISSPPSPTKHDAAWGA
jgi:malate dehydrogenase (oxaloacetate-decarboxylating)(NADP+)